MVIYVEQQEAYYYHLPNFNLNTNLNTAGS